MRVLSSRRARIVAALAALTLILVVGLSATRGDDGLAVSSEEGTIDAGTGAAQVSLDTTVFVPAGVTAEVPAPAVILAHGFGGSKDSSRADAEFLAGQGYVVLTYSARGFGESTGLIGLDDPDLEVADARALIDVLGARDDVVQDGVGDPRVGIAGPSYGGALALLTAGYDPRVDAIVPQITWNSLVTAFLPNGAGEPGGATPAAGPAAPAPGVFKRLWAGLFFGSGATLDPAAGSAGSAATDPQCGRFTPEVCAVYAEAATTGQLGAAGLALLERSSPASVLDRITAPTLLVQGESDTLFPLSEADANARGIAATGTPVSVAWYGGGHDTGASARDADRLRELARDWFDRHLRDRVIDVPAFEYAQVTGLSTADGQATSQVYLSPSYPGLDDGAGRVAGAVERTAIPVLGPPQTIVNPPGGSPAAVSSLPGLGQVGSLVSGFAVDLPGQVATFAGAVLDAPVQVVGAPTVSLRVASPTGSAVLFVKLYDVDPDGRPGLPQGLVAPVRLTGLSADLATAGPVTVTLPAVAHRFETGHRFAVAVTTTDQAYQASVAPTTYQVALGGTTLDVPTVDGALQDAPSTPWIPFVVALVLGSALLAGVVAWAGRRRRPDVDEGLIDVPLVAEGLTKAYDGGYVAVRDLSFRVQRGQVVGLLGPNGAGKTTTLRMLMGLILPSEGDIRVFGHRIRPGAPVLSRLGAFVEGTGFLPHLSGTDNLALYWKATGRPAADAHVAEALEIAGLGAAVERTVRTYSQGMRQRLAIAQAMLGLPDLLVLDEPTNGLDPPQIREMREVLRRYAEGDGTATGRTVLVSSHLLAEVEQTCTHVVVMNRGRLIAEGTVADVVGASTALLLEVDDRPAAVAVLTAMDGVAAVSQTVDGVVVELDGTTGPALVRSLVGAGVGVQRLAPRRRLEDVFLSLVGEDER